MKPVNELEILCLKDIEALEFNKDQRTTANILGQLLSLNVP